MNECDNPVKVFAKINLTLNITGKLDNGNHCLDTIVCSVPQLYDAVRVDKRCDDKIEVHTEPSPSFASSQLAKLKLELVSNKNNHTAFRMAQLLKTRYNLCGLDIVVQKGIPMMGGLGGSAAAAAGVLNIVEQMFDLNLSPDEKKCVGEMIGADVPFLCRYGCARISGLDQSLQYFSPSVKRHKVVVLSDSIGISTRAAFELFAGSGFDSILSDNDLLVESLIKADNLDWQGQVGNALLSAATLLDSSIKVSIDKLYSAGAKVASMTGSGSACFGVFLDEADTVKIAEQLSKSCNYAYACTIF